MIKKYNQTLKKEVNKFRGKNIDSNIFESFLKRIVTTDNLTKEHNIDEHICAFFVPVNRKTKSIYLVHHIKADDWIPPGGHIKYGEHPLDTVTREYEEELADKIDKSQLEYFNLSIKDVSDNPRSPCKLHYDFWYLVDVPKKNFKYLKKEFYNAYWHPLNEATFRKIKTPQYNKIVRTLKEIL